MKYLNTIALLMCFAVCAQVTPDTPGWTAFEIPSLEAPSGTPVDVGYLTKEPAGSHGFIRVKDGHFVDDRNIPLRFFGTNMTGDACFPEPEDGRKLAKRLRQYGFNCLRLHFMDLNWNNAAIWQDAKKSEFNEENLKKLDQFIANCIQEGVWINVNLHVARMYPNQPGGIQAFRMGKILDRWYPPYIEYQEDYASKLLGRVNTVTGIRYAETPGIMCIELNNENTMITDFRDDLKKLPPEFQAEFVSQWTAWLKKKYGTDEALRASWEKDYQPLGETVVSGKNGWSRENAGGSDSILTQTEDGDAHWQTTKIGSADWNLQLQIKKIKLEPGLYTLSFKARSVTSSTVSHSIMLDAAPWQGLGLRIKCELTPEWQDFSVFGEVPVAVNDAFHRVNFSINNKLGDVEIKDFQIRRGGGRKLPPECTLAGGIPIPAADAMAPVMEDFYAFLIDTEMATTRRLKNHVTNVVGCKMPVTDTQVSYGTAGGIKRETEISDYIDIHAYWQHPSYTKDEKGTTIAFRIQNSADIASPSGGCIIQLAPWRVQGKPFSVSEYNIPAPNDHSADLFLLYSVIASIQDWDAFFSYTYFDFGHDYSKPYIRSYFQIAHRDSMLVHMPFASILYRNRLMPTAAKQTVVGIPRNQIASLTTHHKGPVALLSQLGGEGIAAVSQRIVNRIVDDIDKPALVEGDGKAIKDDKGVACSEDGSFRIFPGDPDGAWTTLNLPSARLVAGHVAGRSFTVGDVRFDIANRPWPKDLPAFSCISMIALDEKPIAESRRILLAASARSENTNFKWNETRTTVAGRGRDRWAEAPVVSEIVPATVALPFDGDVKLTVLKGDGTAAASRVVSAKNIAVTADDKSLWYLIER